MSGPDGEVRDWYGKTHLVLVGENIPWLSDLPILGQYIPHLDVGDGGKVMEVGGFRVLPNICIETAVERVVVNQMRTLSRKNEVPDVVVTVTNDGWFDNSSIIEHHLRCAQMVAVGVRRPIVSAANNGPTAHVDSYGKVVARLPTGADATLVTRPLRDRRSSLYVKIGDTAAWVCVVAAAYFCLRRRTI